MRRTAIAVTALAMVFVACNGETSTTSTTTPTAPPPVSDPPSTTQPGPPTSPAEVVFNAQESDGTSIVVASVTLPAPGFIAVHGNAGGSPGPIIGNSNLLPAGTSTDVVVQLDPPLTATDLLFPMAHIDMDEDGQYLFAPPDNAVDIPATTADGSVAVVGAEVTVTSSETSGALQVVTSDLGDILSDGEGNTLYLFTPDAQGESTCYDQCEQNWPPFTGMVTAGSGVDASLIDTVTRTDGSTQVTYNGWPLYYFAGDSAPGDTNGQGLNGIWFVVSPAGDAIS
ncbi:MAG: hypothetical protein R3258_05080 [Acidimicrobiia bacterium]|nr:hypothetical protein [Acidimicrobiia bacterium]